MPNIAKQTNGPVKKAAKGSSIVDRIAPIDFTDNYGIKINVYGRSGTGKTHFWGSFPKPILVMLNSGGRKPGELRTLNTKYFRDPKVLRQAVVHNMKDHDDMLNYLHGKNDFASVVYDHASGLQNLALQEVMGIAEIPTQLHWGFASRDQYSQAALATKEVLRGLLNLDCNVVIVAQERAFDPSQDSDVMMPYVGSALMPSVTGWLNPTVDYIGQTFIRQKTVEQNIKIGNVNQKQKVAVPGQVEFCLRTGPDPVFTTKFRLPDRSPPDVIVDPNFTKIDELINPK